MRSEAIGSRRQTAEVVATRRKHVPLRRCIACGERRPKRDMLRVVRTPAGHVDVDVPPKAPGRGAYVCRTGECLTEASDGKAIRRALDVALPAEAADLLQELARKASASERDDSCSETVEVS